MHDPLRGSLPVGVAAERARGVGHEGEISQTFARITVDRVKALAGVEAVLLDG